MTVQQWNMLLREVVVAPPLELFRASLDGALSNLVSWKVSLSTAVGLELDDLFISPSSPNHSTNITLEMLKFAHPPAVQNIILKPTETIVLWGCHRCKTSLPLLEITFIPETELCAEGQKVLSFKLNWLKLFFPTTYS